MIINICPEMSDWMKNFSPSILGACVGGFFATTAVFITHYFNRKLAFQETKKQEKITILSLNEELKVIMDCYRREFEELFNTIDTDYFIKSTYSITQEYFTIYKNNSNKLGLIENDNLRNLFIKIHIQLNRFIEYLIIYEKSYNQMLKRRNCFLNKMFPEIYNLELLNGFDTYPIIYDLKNNPKNNVKLRRQSNAVLFDQFMQNDDQEIKSLHEQSLNIKSQFDQIVIINEQIQNIIEKMKL